MDYRIRNYTYKGKLCLSFYISFLVLSFYINDISGQNPDFHPILTPYEPEQVYIVKSPQNVELNGDSIDSNLIQHLDFSQFSDNQRLKIDIPSFQSGPEIQFQNFNLNIPEHSVIQGIQCIIEGFSEGEQASIKATQLQLLDQSGRKIGDNKYRSVLLGEDWPVQNDQSDKKWMYGYSSDNWGLALNESLVNHENFGLSLILKNTSDSSASVSIDRIQLKVFYTPIYSICDHDCVSFFVPKEQDVINYTWKVPPGFELLSGTVANNTINLSAIGEQSGYHRICLDIEKSSGERSSCCRWFLLDNCQVAHVSGNIWIDANANGIQDLDEGFVEGIKLYLFNDEQQLVSSTYTGTDGKYLFENLPKGYYYLKLKLDDGQMPSYSSEDIDETVNSDFDITQPETQSKIFELRAGEILENMDFGIYHSVELKGSVWHDLNANGFRKPTENGIEGVEVHLLESMTQEVMATTETNQLGEFVFDDLVPGIYIIQVLPPQNFKFSPRHEYKAGHNVFDFEGFTEHITISSSTELASIDAGIYKYGSLSGVVWNDENGNGLREGGESSLSGFQILLLDSGGTALQQYTSGSNGQYSFEHLMPGSYQIEFVAHNNYVSSPPNIGDDETIDSDIFEQTGKFLTADIILQSCEQKQFVDAGFMLNTSSISGLLWKDIDLDAKKDPNDPPLSLQVQLRDSLNQLVAEIKSGSDGTYQFQNITSGRYYIVFEKPLEYIFTTAHAVEDTQDSDVTNSIVPGSTDLLELLPGVPLEHIDAGYIINLSNIAGKAWKDENRDHMNNLMENGFENVEVYLFNESGTLKYSTLTDENGNFLFSGIISGLYYLKFSILPGYKFSDSNVGSDEKDSDVTGSYGPGSTDEFLLEPGAKTIMLDAGYQATLGGVQGMAWLDLDKNGIRTENEPPVPQIEVNLYDKNGVWSLVTTTDSLGKYAFLNIPTGEYYIQVQLPEQSAFTEANQGTDFTVDSDITEEFGLGSSGLFTTISDEIIADIDFGYIDIRAKIRGNVWEDLNADAIRTESEPPIPSILVSLFDSEGNFVSDTLTNNDGEYEFNSIDTGSYYVEFQLPNFYSFSATPNGPIELDADVTGSNGPGTTDVFHLAAFEEINKLDAGIFKPVNISGEVWEDLNGNQIQDETDMLLDGLTIILLNQDFHPIDSTISDMDGKYEFPDLEPGIYAIRLHLPEGFNFVDYGIGMSDDLNSDIFNISKNTGETKALELISGQVQTQFDIGLYHVVPMTASIGDLVWLDRDGDGLKDVDEHGMNEILVSLRRENGELVDMQSTGLHPQTGDPGFYIFENVEPGMYYLEIQIVEGFEFSPFKTGMDTRFDSDINHENGPGTTELFSILGDEQILDLDAGIYQNATIGDFVWGDQNLNGLQDEDESGINGVKISVYNELGEKLIENFSKVDFSTGKDGYYNFSLAPGNYFLKFDIPPGLHFSAPLVGDDQALDSDVDGSNGFGTTPIIQLFSGEQNFNIDVGMSQEPGSIGDQLWLDINANGILEEEEPGINDILVKLFREGEIFIDSTRTGNHPFNGQDGYYLFDTVAAGNYYVEFNLPEQYTVSPANRGGSDALDSDIVGVFGPGTTALFNLGSGENERDLDGAVYIPSSLGDYVWYDEDGNGLQDSFEMGMEGIEVMLFDNQNNLLEKDTTDAQGAYLFSNLKKGLFFIKVLLPEEYQFTQLDMGVDDALDSDVLPNGSSPLISLAHGIDFLDLDVGLVKAVSLVGSKVWHDLNGDGLQSLFEEGMMDVRIELYNSSDSMIRFTYTDVLGDYLFNGLDTGDYKLKFIPPEGFKFSGMDLGDDIIDSDVDHLGWTDWIQIQERAFYKHTDAGMFQPVSIVSTIWYDSDANGIRETEESGIGALTVSLYNEDGDFMDQTSIISFGQQNLTIAYAGDLVPGGYFLRYELSDQELVETRANAKPGSKVDSDVVENVNGFESPHIFLRSGESSNNLGAGFYKGAIIGDRVWLDIDHNGRQDEYEPGLRDIPVKLFSLEGDLVANEITDEQGKYLMTRIKSGEYFLKYDVDQQYNFSSPNMDRSRANDSNVNHAMGWGTTSVFGILPEYENYDMDAGVMSRVLAAEDLNFSGENIEAYNYLHFYPVSEENIEAYVIEKQGLSGDFEWLSSITPNSQNVYEFRDYNIQSGSTNYYRLKEIDRNGNATYSRVISITAKENFKKILYITPNPAKDYIYLKLSTEYLAPKFRIDIQSINGQLVYSIHSQSLDTNQSQLNIKIDAQDWPSGIYMVRYLSDEEQVIERVILSK